MSERDAFTRARGGGFGLRLSNEERALVARLLDELAALLTEPVDPTMTERLFPVVHPDHPEMEAEYQRLMRDELVTSRLAGIATVKEVLAGKGTGGGNSKKVTFDESELVAFMQALNGVRLVLGTILGITDDVEDQPETALVPEYQLYAYLSWVLDSAVHALTGI
jgi:hypothetical protein